ncbi:MAG: EAL domain-containing protein [Methylococcaceae bacterium]
MASLLALFVFFGIYVYSEKQIDRANELRQSSYQLVDQLRQSSDDLTRMARTYVVTGDPRYKQYHRDILDIRNGKQPRPEGYFSVYWDRVLANAQLPPPETGQAVALLDLMRQSGFTGEELGKLAQVKVNSDALTALESEAMKLRESVGADATANRAKALLMLHDENFHQMKAKIMTPINEVYLLMDKRTLAAVHTMAKTALMFRLIFIVTVLGAILMLWRTYAALRTTLGASADDVHAQLLRIGRGDFSTAITLVSGMENSVLAGLYKMQNDLYAHEAEHKRIQQLLKDSETYQYAIFEATPDAMLISNEQGIITQVNQQAERLLGYSVNELIGLSIDALTPQRFRAGHPALRAQYAASPVVRPMGAGRAVMALRKDGREVDVEISLSPIQTAQGLFFASALCDITERKHAEAMLQASEAHFRRMADCSPMMIWITDALGEPTFVNQTWFDFTGLDPAQTMTHESWIGTIHPDDREAAFAAYYQHPEVHAAITAEYRLRNASGEWCWILDKGMPLYDGSGSFIGYMGSAMDITDRKIAEGQIKQLAFYDPLTQLPNRRLLQERLKHSINMERRDGKQLALLMLDLDRFKAVNDSLGHLAGDELLQQVAARITARLRDVDMVVRLGGDEFIVLLEDIAQPEDAGRVAEEIITDLTKSFCLSRSDNVQIGASIGISLYPQHGNSPETLMNHADAALYQAKDAGRGCFAYFAEDLTIIVRERIELESRLRRAVQQQELQLFYQPQVDIAGGRIVGTEALVRWQDPEGGLVLPSCIIPIAEQTDLIVEIGEWVLRETCRQGRLWLDAGLPELTLAVNVSPHQFRRGDICAVVAAVLSETGFPPEQLELEISETGLMENQDNAVAILHNLRAQGVRLAIDDFGTGFSSLGYLKHFPLDVLKIDKSFIDDIPFHQDGMEIAATIIAMSHILGFKALAEGVETPEQLAFLQEKGCDSYQGHIKSRPIPAEGFTELLRAQQRGR